MRMRARFLAAVGVAALVAGGALPAMAQDVTEQHIITNAKTPGDVVTYGLGPQAQRFSRLKTLNRDNIKSLVPAWSFSFGGEKQRGQESQALVKEGIIYVTGSYSRMYAIDSRTGDKKWEYDARPPVAILRCCDVVNRGAALHKDNVYFGTLDAKLVALNTKTGKVVWRKDIDDFKAGYSYTAAPIIVKGKIITGVSGGEFGVIGWIEAFDAKTGEEVWKFQVGTGVVSSPITWEEDGEQWVGVAAGWGGAVPRWGGEVAKSTAGINQDGSFWAFKLPRTVASR